MSDRRIKPITEGPMCKGGHNPIPVDAEGYAILGPRPPKPMGSSGCDLRAERGEGTVSANPCYTRTSMPDFGWREYQKVATTKMVRIQGPFAVQTREGLIFCEDGFLAVDSGGWPYPIAADEQERIYRPVESGAASE